MPLPERAKPMFSATARVEWKGRAVYTVPTRALANDKFREWQARGWGVGLVWAICVTG